MKRREFIINHSKLGLGALLLPSLFSACEEESLFENTTYNGKVIIIGAGVAGLYAGYLLKEKGIQFTILEASNRAGGRLGKNENFAEFPIDTGGQWLHGEFSILGDLVKSTNTETFFDNSENVYWHEEALKDELPSSLQEILENAGGASDDISVEQHFYNEGGTNEDIYLLHAVTGDVGASPNKVSSKWESAGYDLQSYGADDHKFRETFFDLINDNIISEVEDNIQFNTIVTAINYNADTIEITDSNGQNYSADKVIIAVPITVLKDGDINFTPALPSIKTESFQQLGMEAGMKAFLRFSNKFTEVNVLGGKTCASYAVESYNRDSNDLVLFGFVMGDQAKALSEMGEAAALQALLSELDVMFDGAASASFVSHFFQDWYNEPFIRGAYSYPLVGSDANTRKNIAVSVDNKLYFAGEATNHNGHHQTVHGAVETAYREVINILKNV